MLDPHQLRERLTVLAGLSLLGMSIVPTVFARPLGDGGELVKPAGVPTPIEASGSGFDWSAALVVVLIGLAVLVTAVAVRHTANRNGSRLAAR